MDWKRLGIVAVVIVLTAHCGSSGSDRHDALPPPPPPSMDASDPFTSFTAYGVAFATDGGPPNAVVYLAADKTIAFRLDAARVTAGGTLISVGDGSQYGLAGSVLFTITVAPDGSGSRITLEVDLGDGAATTTKHYSFSVPGSGNGTFVVTEG